MVLWRPGLRLNAPHVEFPLDYRDLDRYSATELLLFTREAARVHDKYGNSRRYTCISLKQLLSSISMAWEIIDERRAARRISVLDHGCATTRTVYVRPSSGEEHIYLSPWTNADQSRSTDNDSEWSSVEHSDDSGHSTDEEPPKKKGKQRRKLSSKNLKQGKGKAKWHSQRQRSASKVKSPRSNKVHDDSEEYSEHSPRRTHFIKLFEDSSSSDSEPIPRRTRTNRSADRGKTKGKGNSKSKSKPVAPKINHQDQARPLNDPGHAASPFQGSPSTSRPYKGCTDHHNDYRQASDRPRSTPYSYSGSQLHSASRSEPTQPPRPRHQSHERQNHTPKAPHTAPEPPKPSPSHAAPPATSPKFNPYAALSLPPTSSIATIKATIRALSLRFHPDKQRGKSDAEIQSAYDRICEINNAKDILLDETSKKAYDEYGVVDEAVFEEWMGTHKSKRGRR